MRIQDTHTDEQSGRLTFDVYENGRLIERFDEKNLIVGNSKTILSRLLGGDGELRSIGLIGFGTNGVAPAVGNTSLTAPYFKAIEVATYPNNHAVSFGFSLLSSENNGMAIREFGLLCTDGSLYARKVRSIALTKSSAMSITGSWLITF